MNLTSNQRTGLAALVIVILDQLTKLVVLKFLNFADQRVLVDGFFKFVHWGNTGAGWGLFRDRNELLTVVSLAALLLLFLMRRHFHTQTSAGDLALGLMFGGIVGNIIDRFVRGHVVDFIYFYIYQRSGRELGFPAFNVADSAICIGVGLLLVLQWRREHPDRAAPSGPMTGTPTVSRLGAHDPAITPPANHEDLKPAESRPSTSPGAQS